MAVIKPFTGYLYNKHLRESGTIGKLVAPPYDVISRKQKEELAQEPYNIVQITLGRDQDDYQGAADRFRSWIKAGLVEKDNSSSFYIYEQEFELNPQLGKKVRTGFISLVRLEEFEKKVILPHEKTMPKYSQDRLLLLQAVKGNLEQIFGIFNDTSGKADEILEQNKRPKDKLFEFTDYQGTIHRLWRMSDLNSQAAIRKILNPRTIIIADGHHRYETSLQYRRQVREKLGDPLAPIPEDYVMMNLVNMKNPGLVILPTHRLVHGLPPEKVKSFFQKCEAFFEVKFFSNEREMEDFLLEAPPHTIGVYDKLQEVWGAITLKREEIMDERLGQNNVNRHLDTAILHELVLKEVLGIDDQAQAKNEYIDYLRGTKDVFAIAREENGYQLVFVLRPTPMEAVEQAVTYMQRMPQKSTYFYPKIWSGLVFYLFENSISGAAGESER